MARMFLHSSDSRMTLLVHPLQRGRLGDTVRVRLDGSVKLLQGRVAGAAYLETSY
jgi:flagella basal body P-ring formation protein FlgA